MSNTNETLIPQDMLDQQQLIEMSLQQRDTEEVRQQLIRKVADYRYAREIAGVFVNGVKVGTDRIVQSTINNCLNSLREGFVSSIEFKAENGWVMIGLDEIRAIAQHVSAYVQQCFVAEKAHLSAISALTTLAEMDAYDVTAGWPSQS